MRRSGDPTYLDQLLEDQQTAKDLTSLPHVKKLAAEYDISLGRASSVSGARTKLLQGLESLIEQEQGSRSSSITQGSRGGLYSQGSRKEGFTASKQLPRTPSAGGSACHGAAAFAGGKVSPCRRLSLNCSAPAVTMSPAMQDRMGGAHAPLSTRLSQDPSPRLSHATPGHSCPASELVVQLLEEQEKMQLKMAQLEASNAQLKRQNQASQADVLALRQRLAELEGSVQQLQAAAQRHDSLSDEISLMAARQEQQARRRQVEECQRGVVVKDSEPVPPGPLASCMQQLLRQRLGIKVTVQNAQRLGSERSGSGGAPRRFHAYRVILASSAERLAVLKAKADRLRGTPMSIDVLLTPEQLARRQQQQPVARQAKAAGCKVQWRLDTLLVDGVPYEGKGSLPPPSQQSAHRNKPQPAGQRQQPSPCASIMPQQQQDSEGFQPSKAQLKRQKKQAQEQAKQQHSPAKTAAAAKAVSHGTAKAKAAAQPPAMPAAVNCSSGSSSKVASTAPEPKAQVRSAGAGGPVAGGPPLPPAPPPARS